MKTIIIDLSRGDEAKILYARITNTVSIISGFYLTFSPQDDTVETIARKLLQEGLLNLPTCLIPPEEMLEKHIFHFPKIPEKEILKILPREIATVADSTEPTVFHYLDNGIIEDRQVEKIELAAFFARKDTVFSLLNRFKAKGIPINRIIPEAQGLKTLVDLNPQLADDASGAVFMELLANRIDMNFFKHKYWGLQRDFLFRVEPGEDLDEEDFARIST